MASGVAVSLYRSCTHAGSFASARYAVCGTYCPEALNDAAKNHAPMARCIRMFMLLKVSPASKGIQARVIHFPVTKATGRYPKASVTVNHIGVPS